MFESMLLLTLNTILQVATKMKTVIEIINVIRWVKNPKYIS